MHTSKSFPYRPAVVARQHKPNAWLIAGRGNHTDMVRPHYDPAHSRPGDTGEFPCPFPSEPEAPIVQFEVVHQEAPAPRSHRASFGALGMACGLSAAIVTALVALMWHAPGWRRVAADPGTVTFPSPFVVPFCDGFAGLSCDKNKNRSHH